MLALAIVPVDLAHLHFFVEQGDAAQMTRAFDIDVLIWPGINECEKAGHTGRLAC